MDYIIIHAVVMRDSKAANEMAFGITSMVSQEERVDALFLKSS